MKVFTGERSQRRDHSPVGKESFKLRELMFGGKSQELYQIQLRDVESVFFVEPVTFRGSFRSALEGFIHRNVG